MNDIISINVMDGGLGTSRPRTQVTTIARVPQNRSGYQVVRYQGKNYQLFGGIRTDHFISIDSPIKGRA